ncbi:MAG: hypothetical protein ACRYGP_28060 [Janthinobacterium lividum]
MLRQVSTRVALLVACIALAPSIRPAAAYMLAEAIRPMTVTLVRSDASDCGTDCPEWLALTGKIVPGTPALLSAALARLGARRVPILVDSPGGSVEPAMAMGHAIRARKLDVAVAGTALTDCAKADKACAVRLRAGERPGFVAGGTAACASACALLLAAGTDRAVGADSYVGVHQMTQQRTFTRVMNYFRIMRRLVGGRIVEVSRTLVSTKPVSSRTVRGAAPEALYSEVDRYLLRLGIGEGIMPLMRSAPPSGIHWMTPSELSATHLSNDTMDARSFVARGVEPKAPSGASSAMALATIDFGGAPRAGGVVDWRLDHAASGSVLVGAVSIPDRQIKGTVSISRDTTPASTTGFLVSVDLGPPSALVPGDVWTAEAPRICDDLICTRYSAPVATRDDGAGKRDFGVPTAWNDGFLSAVRDRDWMVIDLTSANGRHGLLRLSLKDNARTLVAAWQHACCGLAAASAGSGAGDPTTSPTLPARAAPPAFPPIEERASYWLRATADGGRTIDGKTAMTWTPMAPLDVPGIAGSTALVGSLAIPSAGLRLTVQAGRPANEGVGRIALDISLAQEPQQFGPVSSVSISPIPAPYGGASTVAASVELARTGSGFHAVLSPAPLADGAVLTLNMADATGRRMIVTLPLDGPLGRVFDAIRRARDAATG